MDEREKKLTQRTPLSAVDRRRFLTLTGQGLTAAMTLALLPGDELFAATALGDTPFKLGIASGDPEPDGIVIWTRLAPNPLAPDGTRRNAEPRGAGRMAGRNRRGDDQHCRSRDSDGLAEAAHSVHVEIHNLSPGRRYFYRFNYRGDESPVGHTRTAAGAGGACPGAQVRLCVLPRLGVRFLYSVSAHGP
jgi:alkaline phosphatase D